MALGRRSREHQQQLFVAASELPQSEGHIFYKKLNELLAQAGFDNFVEELCRPFYHATLGRRGIAPGVYFRMLLVGYFEGLGSQRGIAWRCADSLSLRAFLSVALTEDSPDHSSLTRIRDPLPLTVQNEVFRFVLQAAAEHGLLRGKTVAVDATTLEANAAMKSIIRLDTGEDWKEYLKRLMQEEGLLEEDDQPTDEDLRRFDQSRKNKKVSNSEWVSETDPESRITRMKDGRTHLVYKAENIIDVNTELVLAAEIYPTDTADTETLIDSVMEAQVHLNESGLDKEIEEIVADKGYHAAATLELADALGMRTYIPEPRLAHQRRWTNKPAEFRRAVVNNRRRTTTRNGRHLQRQRSERVERSFAHMCETGGARRSWLRGIEKVRKRYLITAVARNLGLLMRAVFGIGTARGLQREGGCFALISMAWSMLCATLAHHFALWKLGISRSLRRLHFAGAYNLTMQLVPRAAISTGW